MIGVRLEGKDIGMGRGVNDNEAGMWTMNVGDGSHIVEAVYGS